jgi:hypothetical protein
MNDQPEGYQVSRTRGALAAILLAILSVPAPAGAWGFEAHQFIMARAIELLPAPMRPFYEANRVFVVEHAVDPDLWRLAGFTEEPPRHFLDLDAYGTYPFDALPRDYKAALKKFGAAALTRNGLLPWRAADIAGRLRRAFEQQQRGAPYALDDVKFLSAVVGHYVADSRVPLHATRNHDGQLTGQDGIHARFETTLVQRYQMLLAVKPGALRPVPDPTQLMFDALLASFQLAAPLLGADREAIGSRAVYDDRYYKALFERAGPILARCLSDAITDVASVIAGAWEQAGKPALPVNPARPVQRRQAGP